MSEEQKSYSDMSDAEKKKEDWMNSKWRPMMGWMYMIVCMTDFVVFPVLWSLLQAVMKVSQITQWNPLTLQGAGLFHIAMGAVLGIAAFGRTQEKLGGANNGGASPSPSGFAVSSAPQSSGFSSPSTGFSSPAPAASSFSGGGFGSSSPAASFGGPIATTASGKKIIPDEPQPAI